MGVLIPFDDDSAGEAADVVAIRLTGSDDAPRGIEVHFYHCKFSHGDRPGSRVSDLYEVCGQAQKSILWRYSSEKGTDLFTHLLTREASRLRTGGASRLQLGTAGRLEVLREISRQCLISLHIHIVQPGLSRATASRQQLELLSVTENHLWETYKLPFTVVASE